MVAGATRLRDFNLLERPCGHFPNQRGRLMGPAMKQVLVGVFSLTLVKFIQVWKSS